MAQEREPITFTQNLIDVVSANPGLTVTPGVFTGIVNGNVVVVRGCIRELRYGDGDKDLDVLTLDDGHGPYTAADIANLRDFRERFQEAANFGHAVNFCWDKTAKKMTMLNILPCKCKCAQQ